MELGVAESMLPEIELVSFSIDPFKYDQIIIDQ